MSTIPGYDDQTYLTDVVPTLFQGAFDSVEPVHSMAGGLVTPAPSGTRQNLYTFLDDAPELRDWQGEVKYTKMTGNEQIVVNRKYSGGLEIDKDDISDLSRIASIDEQVRALGDAAAQHPDETIWSFLEANTVNGYDGVPIFDAAHPLKFSASTQSNEDTGGAGRYWYLLDTRARMKWAIWQTREAYRVTTLNADSGNVDGFDREVHKIKAGGRVAVAPGIYARAYRSNQALDATNYAAAWSAMQELKSPRGKPLRVTPTVLMVPPSLAIQAFEIVTTSRNASGADNVLQGTAQVVVNPYLTL